MNTAFIFHFLAVQTIYVACGDGGLGAYYLAGSRLQTIQDSGVVSAVTYDFVRHKVYWTRFYDDGGWIKSTFYRAGAAGADVETLLDTRECEDFILYLH